MFKQLLEGQLGEKKASELAEKKITKGLVDLRSEVHLKHEGTTARLDNVSSTLADFNEKLKAMEKKASALEMKKEQIGMEDSGGRHDAGGGGGGVVAGATTLSGASARDQLKVVVGGWSTPQLKRVLEERARSLAQEWGEDEVQDVYSYKRAQVVYIIFKSAKDVMTFLAKMRKSKPTTGAEGDDAPIWAKASQSPEMRAKTLLLRSAARAIYSSFEEHDATCPRDLLVDYHRNEIVIGNVVVMEVRGFTGQERKWHKERWARVAPHVPVDEIIKASEVFAAPRQE